MTLTPLDLHNDSVEILQTLAFDMRINCMALLLKQCIEGNVTTAWGDTSLPAAAPVPGRLQTILFMSELHASLFASDVLVHGQVLHSVGRLSTNDMTYMYIIFVDIKKLHDKETWSVDADDERGGVTVLVSTLLLVRCNKTCHLVERNVSDA